MGHGPPEAGDAPVTSSIAAAQAVAREHGMARDEAVRIAAGSNVLVHLKPAPVVARVMTGTAILHDDAEQWLTREVAVAAFLAERTDLVVPPSDILPPGPHEQDGLWMTLWKFVPHDAQAPPPEIRDWLERLLAERRPSPTLTQPDIDFLAAYGEPDVEGLETFLQAHALYDVVWQGFEARRRPRAMQRAAASLALLRRTLEQLGQHGRASRSLESALDARA